MSIVTPNIFQNLLIVKAVLERNFKYSINAEEKLFLQRNTVDFDELGHIRSTTI